MKIDERSNDINGKMDDFKEKENEYLPSLNPRVRKKEMECWSF